VTNQFPDLHTLRSHVLPSIRIGFDDWNVIYPLFSPGSLSFFKEQKTHEAEDINLLIGFENKPRNKNLFKRSD